MDFNMEKIFANFSAQTELIIGRLTGQFRQCPGLF